MPNVYPLVCTTPSPSFLPEKYVLTHQFPDAFRVLLVALSEVRTSFPEFIDDFVKTLSGLCALRILNKQFRTDCGKHERYPRVRCHISEWVVSMDCDRRKQDLFH
jgi:hypothetical protein